MSKKTNKEELYLDLPASIRQKSGFAPSSLPNIPGKFTADFVQKAVVKPIDLGVYSSKVQSRPLPLQNPTKKDRSANNETKKRRRRAKKAKVLTAREKRSMHVYDIPSYSRKYANFEPLNALWKDYIGELIGKGTLPIVMCQKLLKADFHGAIITVVPKINNVFTISVRDAIVTLHGNQFRYRSSQRSSKKFKPKPSVDL
ncbi:RNase P/RNase MRP complex subunit [Lunasporangiospora selenospora]|uniref:RNase P/RNase MRP complex subunit n=1 Tax=Lunasporangiospora selenospora TaxID=979761 RepID=A0A9P6KG34_9FUNG|nr:RNase P/RNase MRP complex subunit [Lunasporangiospora selenospora]